jgi:hypothetical protein
VSEGVLAGLNVGWGARTVRREPPPRDRSRPSRRPACAYQIHSPDVVTVTEPWPESDRPKADALVTRLPGVVLGILTADCAPVLFHDAKAGVIGAAPRRLEGAFGGVTDNTIAAMEALGPGARTSPPWSARASRRKATRWTPPSRTASWPPTRPTRFFRAGKAGTPGSIWKATSPRGSTPRRRHGRHAGRGYLQPARPLYSFRRATHRGEPDYGREISPIALR